jgi:hypothetical protein
MRLLFLLVTAILVGAPAFAQDRESSSSGAGESSAGDVQVSDLPVSVDRVREALAKAPVKPLLGKVEYQPDFSVTVEQRFAIEESFRPEDFKAGPVPAGGLYAYEQQRMLSDKVSNPLAQPYAAFSGGELITIAIENLLLKYLGGRIVESFTAAQRAEAEAAARADVERAIAEYCAARPSGGEEVALCAPVTD